MHDTRGAPVLGGPLGSGPPGLCLPCLPYCYAPAAKNVEFCLSVTLLNVRVRSPDFAMNALEYRNGGLFTNVRRSCAAIEIVRPLSQPRYALFTIDVVRPPTWRKYDVARTTSHVRNFSLIYGKHSDDVIGMSGMLSILRKIKVF